MAKNNNIHRELSKIFNHLKQNYSILIWVAVFCVIGIIIGIILVFGEKSYLNLLTTKNQNMLGYISGSASVFKYFWTRLFLGIFALMLLFIFCLNYYSSFLGYLYFAYQTAVCTVACGTLISYQGFSAVLNTIFLIVPSNLILLAILAFCFSVFVSRAKCQLKFKQSFVNSFTLNNFWFLFIVCLILIVALNIIVSLCIPLIIRGIYIIYY